MKSSYAGMTVNERLVLSGHLVKWDEAVELHDRAQMIAILTAVELGSQAEDIVERVLARPR